MTDRQKLYQMCRDVGVAETIRMLADVVAHEVLDSDLAAKLQVLAQTGDCAAKEIKK